MKAIQTARVIWLALLAAVVLYAVVLVVLLAAPSPAPAADVTTLRRILMLMTLATVGAVYVLRQRLPLAAVSPERRATPAPEAVLATYVVCWALSEAVALYGLVLGMVGRSLGEAQPFFIIGAALLLWQRPRAAHFGA